MRFDVRMVMKVSMLIFGVGLLVDTSDSEKHMLSIFMADRGCMIDPLRCWYLYTESTWHYSTEDQHQQS